MTQKSILTISRDTTLQDVRAHVLRQAGFHVASASNDEEAIGFLDRPNSFSLVLMCHSVPEWSRRAIVTKSEALYPKLPILLLCNGYDPTTTSVDSPEAMLEMIRFLGMPSCE